ncbi:MAG TPA: hypothetical protein PKV98_07810 [Burkholderiaceae bacterium]|nr:hypothetical protein [Burkholderiaceae bacterium]
MPTLQQIIAALFARRRTDALLTEMQRGEGNFAGQHHASPARKQRRQIIAYLGRRQGIKWIKHVRANQRANRAELARVEA